MADEYRVGVYEAIAEYTSIDPKSALYITICIVILCDIGCAVGLCAELNRWPTLSSASLSVYFYNESIDCLLLALIRSIFLPLIAWAAVQSGRVDSTNEIVSCKCFKCFYRGHYSRASYKSDDKNEYSGRYTWDSHGADTGQPLLQHPSDGNCDSSDSPSAEGYEAEDAAKRIELEIIESNKLSISKSSAAFRQNILLAVLFSLSVGTQVYVGLKCISFHYPSERNRMNRVGALMGLAVLWANVLSWSLRELVSKGYREDGMLVPSLHPHRLHLHATMAGHWCDVCSTQIKDGRAFRCKLCDFDLCVRCYSRKDKLTMEGIIRGDKGARQDAELSSIEYFERAIRLVRTEWILFAVAMLSLCAFNLFSLTLPKLQGSILDAVVRDKEVKFNRYVQYYFIVGRKLAKTIRCQLFKGIILQDVAFFDGNSSGNLSSRLTNDVSFMVQPIQSMLGSLVSNSILLVGGVVLCFYTSWRLSMLAFTTVGPIVHITQVYARWSSHLNRQIFSALASANGFAVEALSNIRTVKAFSTEELETKKYSNGILTALERGIKDAVGGAGMYTMNSYLDLGAGVLILWYGGRLAMDHEGGLTPGQLITFQLYWNMINSAYKGLIDILTNFTRAAGAASRVFALMDSLPDIDVDAGEHVQRDDIQGHIEFRDVCFSYQMRPHHKVLEGVSISIPPGSTCALVGKSGGGKTTMVNLILRFYDPQMGSVLLDGKDLRKFCLKDVRKQIGEVSQNTELFACSIEENIAYGMEPGSWSRQDVIAAAKKACAHEFICEMSEGYATRVGERGTRISGGQKQVHFSPVAMRDANKYINAAIARVFLRKPRILLLDEATSSLDAESESKVQEALDRLISEGGATVVLVAHRLSTVVNADQIAVVGEGRVVEMGTHDSLIEADGAYAALVKKQLAKRNSVVDADSVVGEYDCS